MAEACPEREGDPRAEHEKQDCVVPEESVGGFEEAVAGEIAAGAAQQLGLVGQVEVHGGEPYAASVSARVTSRRTPQPAPPTPR